MNDVIRLPADVAHPSAGRELTPPRGYNLRVHGLRGLCTLMVFVYHVCNAGLLPWPSGGWAADAFSYLFSAMRYGVEIFFMISGYVIVGSLRRHGAVGPFLVDRAIRIFPVWVPLLVLMSIGGAAFGLKVFKGMSLDESGLVFLANLFFLPPLVPLPNVHPASWSLSYEWIFYGVTALTYWGTTRRVSWALGSAVLLAVMFPFLLPRALFFLPGALAALLPLHFERHQRWFRYPWISGLVFLLAWRATGANEAAFDGTLIRLGEWQSLGWTALALLAGIHLFGCIAAGPAGTASMLESPPFRFLGTISYSFYLIHPLSMFAVKRAVSVWVLPVTGPGIALAVFALLSLLLALLLSWLSWRLLERDLAKRLRTWLEARFRGNPATVRAR